VANESADPSLRVAAHRVTALGLGGAGNSVLDVMPLARLTGDWWIAFRMLPGPAEAANKDVAIWIGSAVSLLLDVTWDTSMPGQMQVTIGSTGGALAAQTLDAGDLGAERLFSLSCAEGRLHAWVDGVEVMHLDGVDMSLIGDGRFDLFINATGTTSQPRITHVEVGVGVYGG